MSPPYQWFLARHTCTRLYTFWLGLWCAHCHFSLFSKHWNKSQLFSMYPVVCCDLRFHYFCPVLSEIIASELDKYRNTMRAWIFDINMEDACSAVSSLIVSLQPLNPRQAMVKRLSVVNLENFRRQYARRRWKVKCSTWSTVLCFPYSNQGFHLKKKNVVLIDFVTHSLCFYLFNSCHSELLLCATI